MFVSTVIVNEISIAVSICNSFDTYQSPISSMFVLVNAHQYGYKEFYWNVNILQVEFSCRRKNNIPFFLRVLSFMLL